MKLEVENQEALADEKIRIRIFDLLPYSQLRVSLKMEFPWCSGEEFSSYAVFISGESGEIDLDTAIPIEGTYKTADSMGLIYSLEQTKSEGKNIGENISVDNPILMNLLFETSDDKKEVQLKRCFKTDDIQIKPIHGDFTGQLFYKKDSGNKTILMLGGSDGHMESLFLMAAPLASRGFNVLTVSYFNSEGLPEKLEEIPLEYFEKIFNWLETSKITDTKDIYIHGTSKGGELALLLASRYKQIKKVVAVEPHTFCFQALDGLTNGKNVSSWSYHGKSIPFIQVDNNIFFEDRKKHMEKGVPFGFTSTYRKSIENAKNRWEARIKVENSQADILLICGEKDNIWNSHEACREIINHLENCDYSHHYEIMSFENMGHPLPIPYIIPLNFTLNIPMDGGVFTSGGTLEGNAIGQYESFQRTIEFFHQNS